MIPSPRAAWRVGQNLRVLAGSLAERIGYLDGLHDNGRIRLLLDIKRRRSTGTTAFQAKSLSPGVR